MQNSSAYEELRSSGKWLHEYSVFSTNLYQYTKYFNVTCLSLFTPISLTNIRAYLVFVKMSVHHVNRIPVLFPGQIRLGHFQIISPGYQMIGLLFVTWWGWLVGFRSGPAPAFNICNLQTGKAFIILHRIIFNVFGMGIHRHNVTALFLHRYQ